MFSFSEIHQQLLDHPSISESLKVIFRTEKINFIVQSTFKKNRIKSIIFIVFGSLLVGLSVLTVFLFFLPYLRTGDQAILKGLISNLFDIHKDAMHFLVPIVGVFFMFWGGSSLLSNGLKLVRLQGDYFIGTDNELIVLSDKGKVQNMQSRFIPWEFCTDNMRLVENNTAIEIEIKNNNNGKNSKALELVVIKGLTAAEEIETICRKSINKSRREEEYDEEE